MIKKGDPIDRGRMQAPLEEWERQAEERLRRRVNGETAEQTAAQAVTVTPEEVASDLAAPSPVDDGVPADAAESVSTNQMALDTGDPAVTDAKPQTVLEQEPEPVDLNDHSDAADPVAEEAEPSSTSEETERKTLSDPADETADNAADGTTEEAAEASSETEPSGLDGEEEATDDKTIPPMRANRRDGAGLVVRTVAEWVIFAVFLLLVGAVTYQYPLPSVLHFLNKPDLLVATEAGLFILACILAAPLLGSGFAALFSFQRKTSSAAALAFLGGAAGFVPAFLHGAGIHSTVPYALSACACLSFEMLSRVLSVRAKRVGEAAVEQMETPHTAFIKQLPIGASAQTRTIVAPGNVASAETIRDDQMPTGRPTSVISFVALLIAITAGFAVVFLLKQSVTQGILLFASFASAGAPLVMGFCASLPFLSAAKALRKRGAVLSGYGAVDTFGEADALYLPERLLYPKGRIKICALRPMCEDGLEDAVLMAASVAAAAETAMAPVLLGMLEGGESLLRPVGRLQIIDEMGMEAWVDGRHVLLGSRNLLRQKRVDLTGRMLLEVEAKYSVKGNDFVYLVVDGVPTALFVLDYMPDKKIRAALRPLTHAGVGLFVGTADANITRDQIKEQFCLKKRMVRILPHQQVAMLTSPAECDETVSKLYIREDAVSIARALTACARLDSTAYVVTLLQVIGVLANVGLVTAVFLLFGWMLEPLEVLAVQAVWAVPPLLLAIFRQHA